jgi:hypothetical protein
MRRAGYRNEYPVLNFSQVRVDETDQVRQSKSLPALLSTLHDMDELLYFQRRTKKALTSIYSIINRLERSLDQRVGTEVSRLEICEASKCKKIAEVAPVQYKA